MRRWGITGGIFPGKDGVVAIGGEKILVGEIFWFERCTQ